MDTLVQISVAIIAVAFVVLLVSLLQTLKTLRAGLDEMRLALSQLRTDVSELAVDAKETIRHTNALTLDIRAKLNTFNSAFQSVQQIGQAVQAVTGAAKEAAAGLVTTVKKAGPKPAGPYGIADAIGDGFVFAMRTWSKMKKR
ncbi:DUF948 domain-containing protein [Paenibacillus arenilitoris]|uniref:DUF948 domain-containing protein n=1 Tax=Paenibacillus arenilitoris TaxID=2772299 RepID=A0A927CH61_9BACL|nr:DUF948 domain-containing protein [Paenibacillus arenilitoris]MBD2868019.1 DUF948 domain-containing protein [Paenibacillus arenilitoris]